MDKGGWSISRRSHPGTYAGALIGQPLIVLCRLRWAAGQIHTGISFDGIGRLTRLLFVELFRWMFNLVR
jgi:hypothetical protein